MTEVLFLSSADIEAFVTDERLIEAVRDGYRERGTGAQARPRTRLDSDDPPGFLTGYTARLPEAGAMGGYMYSAGFQSRDAHFVLPLFDADTGEIRAVLDGSGLNPYKTGAAGAVGVDALAREDATHLGLVGSGTQARGQLWATASCRDLETVSVYSPTPTHRKKFARAMDQELSARVQAVPAVSDAVSQTDIVITATTASEPVFDGELLSPGTHVTAMGQYHPEKREIDATTVARSTYVPDLRARLDRDARAYMQALAAGAIESDHVHAELGEVVAGTAPGRTSPEEITLFDSGGTGIETVAAAMYLYERALEADAGEWIEFFPASQAFD